MPGMNGLQRAEQMEFSLDRPRSVASIEPQDAAAPPGVAAKILHYQFPMRIPQPRSLAMAWH